jgi:hypothetical protein
MKPQAAPTKVTIVLDSGCFLGDDYDGDDYVDIGYFESSDPSDITGTVDGKPITVNPQGKPEPLRVKLGKNKDTIEVRHFGPKNQLKTGVNRSACCGDLLKKGELYPGAPPAFDHDAFDCMIRLRSGTLHSADVRVRVFKEAHVADGSYTNKNVPLDTRPIANDMEVIFQLDAGDILKLVRVDKRGNESVLYSTDRDSPAASRIEIRFEADPTGDVKYFRHALKVTGPHCWLPNPDPPPMNGE